MPHIRVRAIEKKQMPSLSESLIPGLSRLLGSPEDNFTLELVDSTFFQGGEVITSYPFVEVLWFARSAELQTQAAQLITEQVRALTQAADVVVIFQVLAKTAYYENGKSF